MQHNKTSGETECITRWRTSHNNGIPEIQGIVAEIRKECHREQYAVVPSIIQEVYKVLNDIEILAGGTPAKAREGSDRTTIVNSAEENMAKL